jgi:hypothetical protein
MTHSLPPIDGVLKKTPNGVIVICCTVLLAMVICGIVLLAYNDKNADNLISIFNISMNLATAVLAGGSFIAAGAAAKTASKVEQTQNGEVQIRIDNAVAEALSQERGRAR